MSAVAEQPAPGRARGAFSPVTMLVLALVSIFAFAAFMTLSAFEPELQTGHNGRAHALSQSAVGYAAIIKLAQAERRRVTINRGNRGPLPPALTVLTPDNPLTTEELYKVPGGAWLVVLPKWMVGPHPSHAGWVTRIAAESETGVTRVIEEIAPKLTLARHGGATRPGLIFTRDGWDDDEQPIVKLRAGAITSLQTISSHELAPIVTDENGAIIVGMIKLPDDRLLYILSDPDFLNTQGVADINTARAGLAILDSLAPDGEEIMFDVTINGLGRARNILRLAFEPPFLAATLALAAAALLLFWRAAVRSGPSARTERAIALGKAALADNSAALIRLTGRERRMGAGYAALTGATVSELIGARGDERETTQALDSVSASQGADTTFSKLTAEARTAPTAAKMLDAAKKLHAWKEEILRAIR